MSSFVRLIAFATLAVLASASVARAQTDQPTQPDRPYQGLFAKPRSSSEQTLTFLASVGAGYDSNIFAGSALGSAGATPVTTASQPSAFENASTSLEYSVRRKRATLSASGAMNASYYGSLTSPLVRGEAGGVNASVGLTTRTQLAATLDVSYQPFYDLPGSPLPLGDQVDQSAQGLGQAVTLDSGAVAQLEDHSTYAGTVALTHSLTRRLSVSASYGYVTMQSSSHDLDLASSTVGGGIGYTLAKGVSLRIGYSDSVGRYGVSSSSRVVSRGFTGGVDVSRALSLTRRTHVTFTSGLTGLTNTQVANGEVQYYATGQAALTREIGRTWNAALQYSRSASFVDTFLQPVLADGLSMSTGGELGPRVQLQGSVGVSNGNVGLSGTAANHFRTYFGSAGVRFAVSRAVALGADYSDYWYHFADAIELPGGLASRSSRQSVRIYVSLWAPLMGRGREPNAAR